MAGHFGSLGEVGSLGAGGSLAAAAGIVAVEQRPRSVMAVCS